MEGKDNALRFAVGSRAEYRSAVWRLWAQRDDVYLAARVMRGLIKLSMHRSGNWRLAWSEDSWIQAQGSTDRVENRWKRPNEFRAGWIQGPAVIVPDTRLERPFAHPYDPKQVPIVWTSAPQQGCSQRFTILFASPEAAAHSLTTAFSTGDELIGTLSLRNGSSVVLARREVKMVEKESTFVKNFVSDMKISYPGEVPQECAASVFTAGSDDAGHPYIMDMPLGWEHVYGNAGAP